MFYVAFLRVFDDFIERLGIFHRRALNLFLFAVRIFFQGDLREGCGQMIILILSPALEWVVVTFVAIEPRGEEQVRGVLHRISRRAQNLPITRGGILAIRS